MTDALFAYGTLEIPEVMKTVTRRLPLAQQALLHGYGRFLIHGEIFPGVAREEGDSTSGTLYLGVDDRTLALLDRYEGPMYERRVEMVETSEGQEVSVWVYVIPSQKRYLLSSARWDKGVFISAHLDRFIKEHARFGRSS